MTSIQQPGAFLVSHVVYFGPVFLLMLLTWRSVSRLVRQNGVGLTMLFLLDLGLSLGTETRYMMAAFPFFVAMTAKATDWSKFSRGYIGLFCGASFLFSKVWFPINVVPWTETSPLLEFPAQNLFMNFGPWISPVMYAVQGVIVLLCAIALWLLGRRNGFSSAASAAGSRQ
jgi:hypothetical protein